MPSVVEGAGIRLQARLIGHGGTHQALANARAAWAAREGLVLELGDDHRKGLGEATPLPGHSPESLSEAQADLTRWLREPSLRRPPWLEAAGDASDAATGSRAEERRGAAQHVTPLHVTEWLAEQSRSLTTPSARFALEAALLDYWSQRLRVPPWQLLGGRAPAAPLSVSRVVDLLDERVEALVERALAEGVHTIKLKVGRSFEEELAALQALRARWGPSTLRLRLDVNRSWPPEETSPRLERLAAVSPEWIEEPSTAFDTTVPGPVALAVDESLLGVSPSPAWLEARPAVGVLVLKPMLLGGISRCLEWGRAARQTGRVAVISHLFDGPIALAACVQLACALPSARADDPSSSSVSADASSAAPPAAPSERAQGLSLHGGLQAWRARACAPSYVQPDRIVLPAEPGLGVAFGRRLSVFAAAEEVPERVALASDELAVSYAMLARGVGRVVAWLMRSSGAAPASDATPRPVSFIAEPRLGQLLLLYACVELGWTVLPLHPRASGEERLRITTALRPGLCVDEAQLARFESWLTEAPLALDEHVPAVLDEPDPEMDLAWLLTSGSTGTPRAVRLSRRAFLASADASAQHLGWRDDDRWLLTLPFAHVGGLSVLTRCLIARRTVILGAPRIDGTALARQGVTLLSLVPTQLARLLEDPSFEMPPTVRGVLLGGAGAPSELVERARQRGIPALRTYGLTEACSQVATEALGAEETSRREGYVGSVLPPWEVRIDEAGRIYLRGEPLCSGYVAAPLAPGEWFATSDLGELVGNRLHVFGRCDNVLVSGGENVTPEGVEVRLTSHSGVSEACVVGVPDVIWGQRIVALLVLREGTTLEEVEAWARARLGGHQRPRALQAVPALPLLPSGKVDRAAAARLAATLLGVPPVHARGAAEGMAPQR